MTTSYVLTTAAEADLRGIIRYTRQQWGDTKVRTYITKLERSIERLALEQGAFRQIDSLHPALRVARCEHHFVFCLPRGDAPALIVAILHERMDLMARLTERLE